MMWAMIYFIMAILCSVIRTYSFLHPVGDFNIYYSDVLSIMIVACVLFAAVNLHDALKRRKR